MAKLPEPSQPELELSAALSAHINTQIQQSNGRISFHDFMQAALYTPELGYYMNTRTKLGREGDFTTAPEICPLFGACIAEQAMEVLSLLDTPTILEFGAGSGRLAVDILITLAANQTLPEHYYILELSAGLQQQQHATLSEHCPELLSRVTWLHALPDSFEGFVIANEVLDAMPVHLCDITAKQEYYVTSSDDGWQFCKDAPSTPILGAALEALNRDHPELPSPYTSEVNLYLQPWLQSLSQSLTKGSVLLIDYGYPAATYYHPDRMQGTLMCHYRHLAHTDPLLLVGLQDITAHVDFTAVAEAAVNSDFQVQGYATQAAFLLGAGLVEKLATDADDIERLQFKQAIMQLTSPSEMGELFNVIQLNKNLDLQLSGFKLLDMRYKL